MSLDRIALGINSILGILLIARLLSLRLHRVYVVFSVFVILDLAGSFIFFLQSVFPRAMDYRVSWMALTVVSWGVLLWLVYMLLAAVLATLPGILSFSRKLLNAAFVVAGAIAVFTVRPNAIISDALVRTKIQAALSAVFAFDQIVSTTALIVLLAILAFVLWFPVQMPRNLVMFSIGLVLYFAAQIALLVAHGFPATFSKGVLSAANTLLPGMFFLYWAVTITAEGQRVPIRIGHRWEPREQQRLIDQLESMNAALLRGARRS